MLSNHEAGATVAVRDIGRAGKFYEEILGLKRIHDEGGEAFVYQTGKSTPGG